jgi:hypothetical protein
VISALSAGWPRLVARSRDNGDELSVDLPSGAIGTPMTYILDGAQYIAVAIGGSPREMIAFRLPELGPW